MKSLKGLPKDYQNIIQGYLFIPWKLIMMNAIIIFTMIFISRSIIIDFLNFNQNYYQASPIILFYLVILFWILAGLTKKLTYFILGIISLIFFSIFFQFSPTIFIYFLYFGIAAFFIQVILNKKQEPQLILIFLGISIIVSIEAYIFGLTFQYDPINNSLLNSNFLFFYGNKVYHIVYQQILTLSLLLILSFKLFEVYTNTKNKLIKEKAVFAENMILFIWLFVNCVISSL